MNEGQKRYWLVIKKVAVMREFQKQYYAAAKKGAPDGIKKKRLAQSLALEAEVDVLLQQVFDQFPEQKPPVTPDSTQTSIDLWLSQ